MKNKRPVGQNKIMFVWKWKKSILLYGKRDDTILTNTSGWRQGIFACHIWLYMLVCISHDVSLSWHVFQVALLSWHVTVITHRCHSMLLSWHVTVMTCHYHDVSHDASLAWCIRSWCVTVMRHHCHDASLSGHDKSHQCQSHCSAMSLAWCITVMTCHSCHCHDMSLFMLLS